MKPCDLLKKIVTVREAVRILNMSAWSVRQLIRRKQIAATKIGRCWLIYKPSLTWYKRTFENVGDQLVALPHYAREGAR